jgi:hypothetical protein
MKGRQVMKCKTCKYSKTIKRTTVCDYFIMTGEVRGCPAGEECTKWKQKTSTGTGIWKKMKMK